MKLDDERGELSHGEREMLESETDRRLRTRMESDRDQSAQYMRFEYDQFSLALANGSTPEALAIAAHHYAQTVVRYLWARKALEMCGFNPGDYPEWYSKMVDEARRNGH